MEFYTKIIFTRCFWEIGEFDSDIFFNALNKKLLLGDEYQARYRRHYTLFYIYAFRITLFKHYCKNGKIYINIFIIWGKLPVFLL